MPGKMKLSTKKVRARRRRLARLFDEKCFYCGCKMFLKDKMDDPLEATLDHVLPRSKGGTARVGNLIMCCRKCNEDRGDVSFEEYLTRVYLVHTEQGRKDLELRYDVFITHIRDEFAEV